MASVCNAITPPLVVNIPASCGAFSEYQTYSAACGAGSATDACNLSISGGRPPYSTTFSYPTRPTATNCTLNASAFTSGSGASPQFGYGFTASNMCSLRIEGNLRVNYTVTDAAGQSVSGNRTFPVSIVRIVTGGGGGGPGPGPGPGPVNPELPPIQER